MADLAAPLRILADRALAGENVAFVLPPAPEDGVPFWIGETVDHLIETCPLKLPNARKGKDFVDPNGTDICGWCLRVWRARNRKAVADA